MRHLIIEKDLKTKKRPIEQSKRKDDTTLKSLKDFRKEIVEAPLANDSLVMIPKRINSTSKG